MSSIDDLKTKLGGDPNPIILSAIDSLALDLIKLTAKGEEPCSLAKDPGHPGDNWV